MLRKSPFLLLFVLFSSSVFSQTRDEYAALNNRIAQWISREQADSIVPYLDSTMKRAISPAQIADSWDVMEMKYGKFKETGPAVIEQHDPFLTVNTPLFFETGRMNLRVTYQKNLIAGMYILAWNPNQYQVPDYVNTLSFVEHKVTFGNEPVILEGMLSHRNTPEKAPLVIILQGSGPQDMDGSYGSNKIYKDIAWGIASSGIAVFRYPKRTSIYSALYLEGDASKSYTFEEEYITDILLAIEALCKRPDIDTSRIFLFGHSQGGDAAIIAAKKSGRIKGLIMASTTPRKIQELMCEQIDYANGYEPVYSTKRMGGELMKNKIVFSQKEDLPLNTPVDSLPFGTPASYWNYLNKQDKIKDLKSLSPIKLLFLQGKRDYQVTMVDYGLWQDAFKDDPNATFILYPKLNHMYFSGESRSTVAEYDERHNVDEQPIRDVAAWILKNKE